MVGVVVNITPRGWCDRSCAMAAASLEGEKRPA